LIWPKGIGDFVEAARRLQGKARFAIAGIAEPDNPVAVPVDQLESWQQQGLINWLGHREDMPQVFAQAHIVCLPSAYGEGVPRVLIEAAACARPIVSTDTPGCREITRQDENGLLVPPHDLDALCRALDTLIQDAGLRQRFGMAGRHIVEAEFSLEQVNRETLALYATLLANKTPRSSE
jgi:glycosyltransferase involved in cell wall biosynthesis